MISRRRFMSGAGGTTYISKLDKLGEFTFVNALDVSDQHTFTPSASWADYDFIMIVPDIVISKIDEESEGKNWIQYKITDGTLTQGSYDSNALPGNRDANYTALIMPVTGGWCIGNIRNGRPATLTTNKNLSEISIIYGPYGGSGASGYMNGSVTLYGGSF